MISITLRNMCNKVEPIADFRIHVCLDSNVFLDEISEEILAGYSLLVLIPIRLGLDSIHETYLA